MEFGTPSSTSSGPVSAFQNEVLRERFSMVIDFLQNKLGDALRSAGKSSPRGRIDRPHDLLEVLKDGKLLCKLVGVRPLEEDGSEAENINSFRKACIKNGIPEKSLFVPTDLLNPSSLSAICVVNCLQEVRMKLLELDRALLNEHYSTSPSKKQSPMLFRAISGSTSKNNSGLLDILPETPEAPKTKSSSNKKSNRRVSMNTLNTQASLARVQERMASTYKEKCKQLESGNKELVEAVEDLQETIAGLQRSKHHYQLDCEKAQDRNRVMLSNFRVMEAQIQNCVESWKTTLDGEIDNLPHKAKDFQKHIMALSETWSDINENTIAITLAEEEADEERKKVEEEEQEENNNMEEICEKLSSCNVSQHPAVSGAESAVDDLAKAKEMLRKSNDHIFALEKELKMEKEARGKMQVSLTERLAALKFEFADLSNDFRGAFQSSAANFASLAKELQQRIGIEELARVDLLTRFKKEEKRRKQLLNTVHNLKGNIRVMCRIRPVLQSDLAKDDSNVAVESIDDEKLTVTTEATSATGITTTKSNNFEFDRVFGSTSSQQQVFDEVQPLVESVMDGFHSCIFAYGQTGSGKTYTMSGSGPDNRGINYLALEELFGIYEQRKAGRAKYTFKVQNVEIYCEKVIDLLAESKSDEEDSKPAYLDIRANERDGVHMPGCVEIEVSNVDEVVRVMELGAQNRSSAHTKMNMESSRSHSVVMVSVHGDNEETGKSTLGKLVLVDLAGSERLNKSGVQGAQLKEAQAINKSLSCLGDVISALESKAPHVPFRNSKLTTLLQDSLGKDNKALMILQVSPTTYNSQESMCSLNFAARVRNCELGKAKKKERVGDSSKTRSQMKQQQDRIHQLELKIKTLNKKVEESRIEQDSIRAQNLKDAEKLQKKLEERFQHSQENDQAEIKNLREKLTQAQQQSDQQSKVEKLEAALHAAKMEINNLKQQLRSSIRLAGPGPGPGPSPRSSGRSVSTKGTPAPSSKRQALQERRTSVDNIEGTKTPDKQGKKQVSWKNTPQIIFPSEEKKRDENNSTNSDSPPKALASKRVSTAPAPSKFGGASRILQTPGHLSKSTVRAPRRVPTAVKKRPVWQ